MTAGLYWLSAPEVTTVAMADRWVSRVDAAAEGPLLIGSFGTGGMPGIFWAWNVWDWTF